MPRARTVAAFLAVSLQAACAGSPALHGDGVAGAGRTEPAEQPQRAADPLRLPLRFELDGTLPALGGTGSEDSAIFASRLDFGIDDDLLRYRATYRLEAGDVFSFANRPAAGAPLTVAGQHVGQDVVLTLPGLAGAPLSLGVSAQAGDLWQLGGEAESASQRAHLEWSPWRATLRLEWLDRAQAPDFALSLRCEVESSLGLPLHERGPDATGGPVLRVSGRACYVADGTPWAGLPVRTWGLGWEWGGAERESAARVRVIQPEWSSGLADAAADPGYQVGLRHRRDFGLLSAQAGLAVRQSPAPSGEDSSYAPADETSWSANASLTWQLPAGSVSADWAQGVDPLWFMPAAREARDRFGLALDLSPWIGSVAPGPVSELGLRWNWSRLRLPGTGAVAESSLALDVMLLF